MSNENDVHAQPTRVQSYIERLRRQSQRHAEHLVGEIEKLRALTASLEKEHAFLTDRNRKLTAQLEDADRVHAECARLTTENGRLTDELRRANDLIEFYSRERGELRVRLSDIEAESTRYATEYLNVEQQNTMLANLYVTIHRLHATLDRGEVLAAIQEIIINLVGSEELAIFERDGDRLRLAASFGIDEHSLSDVPLDSGWISESVANNTIFVRDEHALARNARETHLNACVPLRIGDNVTGAIAVFRLLQHKPSFESVDHELFELLSSHAAMALYATSLHASAQPKEAA